MKQKFEVPYNFDPYLIDKLIPYKNFIDFIYIPSYFEDGKNSRKDIILRGKIASSWDWYIVHINKIKEVFK